MTAENRLSHEEGKTIQKSTVDEIRWRFDVGCVADNHSLKLLVHLPNLDITLVDLSRPMLNRSVERLRPISA